MLKEVWKENYKELIIILQLCEFSLELNCEILNCIEIGNVLNLCFTIKHKIFVANIYLIKN